MTLTPAPETSDSDDAWVLDFAAAPRRPKSSSSSLGTHSLCGSYFGFLMKYFQMDMFCCLIPGAEDGPYIVKGKYNTKLSQKIYSPPSPSRLCEGGYSSLLVITICVRKYSEQPSGFTQSVHSGESHAYGQGIVTLQGASGCWRSVKLRCVSGPTFVSFLMMSSTEPGFENMS